MRTLREVRLPLTMSESLLHALGGGAYLASFQKVYLESSEERPSMKESLLLSKIDRR